MALPVTFHIEKHLKANMNMRKREILLANFLGGLAWGFGTVVGATIVVAIVLSVLSWLNFVPGINQIRDQIQQTRTERIQKP